MTLLIATILVVCAAGPAPAEARIATQPTLQTPGSSPLFDSRGATVVVRPPRERLPDAAGKKIHALTGNAMQSFQLF